MTGRAMKAAIARLAEGGTVLIDGAMGSELERRGVPMHPALWSAGALMSHPDAIRAIHEDYIRAGAEVIITNSFSTTRHGMEAAGLGDRFAELNRLSVELAREARGDAPVAIAASVSTFQFGPERPPLTDVARNFRDQAEILAEAGADLFTLEMMTDFDHAGAALEACVATGLPVWVGFSCRQEEGRVVTLRREGFPLGEVVESVLAKLPDRPGNAAGIMHSQIANVLPGLTIVREHWRGPLLAYPHQGRFVMPNWIFDDSVAPAQFCAEARTWRAAGAQIVGSCCGLGVPYIEALNRDLTGVRA